MQLSDPDIEVFGLVPGIRAARVVMFDGAAPVVFDLRTDGADRGFPAGDAVRKKPVVQIPLETATLSRPMPPAPHWMKSSIAVVLPKLPEL